MAAHEPVRNSNNNCQLFPKNKCDVENKFDVILEKLSYQDKFIEEIKEHTVKLADTILDPEKGLYARVKVVESWKRNASKVFWIVFSALTSLGFSATIWAAFLKK
jgi:hypothetical protein